jgi:RES domain-containing protein
MEVYRIALSKYAHELKASGLENLWNFEGQEVIYSAASKSLAFLENLVHNSYEMLSDPYEIMVIYVPDDLHVESLNPGKLPAQWNLQSHPIECKELGSQWLDSCRSPLLKVPSAIVNNEFNYLINVNHPDFPKIRIVGNEPFFFDKRLLNLESTQ